MNEEFRSSYYKLVVKKDRRVLIILRDFFFFAGSVQCYVLGSSESSYPRYSLFVDQRNFIYGLRCVCSLRYNQKH